MDALQLSERATTSLLYASAQFVASVLLCFIVLRLAKISFWDKLVVWWNCYDVIVHLTLESLFVYYSINGRTVAKSQGFYPDIWKEYGRADSRWANAEPNLVAMEILTVGLCSLLCIILLIAIVKDKPYRHVIQIILQTCELYGGWMTFGPEWIIGSPSLDTSDPLLLWVYLFFFNFLWVIIPLLLLWQSWSAIVAMRIDTATKKRR